MNRANFWAFCLAIAIVAGAPAAYAQDTIAGKRGAGATPRPHAPTPHQVIIRRPNAAVGAAPVALASRHDRHPRIWWRQHFTTIVLAAGGFYYLDGSCWWPAWGYDSAYDYYEYDGPIYTYGNLLPDQVIINVQHALQDLGYYGGTVTGSLSPATRAAIAAYQQDAGLYVTAVVDAPTVDALGLD